MKRYVYSRQAIFAGTRYDKQAAKILVDSGMYEEAQANAIIDGLFHEDLHAFVHAPNWLEKYLKGIARMIVEESHGSKDAAVQFIENSVGTFDQFLTYVRENRDKLGGAEFDNKFNSNMSYADVVSFMQEIKSELDAQSKEELANMEFKATNYELVPIDSYDQFHRMFGGRITGNGASDKAAGMGGTAWCHANGESTYNSWTGRGGKFYVLMNRDYANIPFNRETNSQSAKDAYGTSLVALLVNRKTGDLMNATLRANHEGNLEGRPADNQYKTYAELSELAGFNVENEIMADKANWDVVDGTANRSVDFAEALQNGTLRVGANVKIPVAEGSLMLITATVVHIVGNQAALVYDGNFGNTSYTSVLSALESFENTLSPEVTDRLVSIRLPYAWEVFNSEATRSGWEWLVNYGGVQNTSDSAYSYFTDANNRKLHPQETWWLDTELGNFSEKFGEEYIAIVGLLGDPTYSKVDASRGVRPLMIFNIG